MLIDSQTGAVTLPNGFVIEPSLTQDTFRSGEQSKHVRKQWAAAGAYMHHDFTGGQVEGKDLLVRLSFYDQLLLTVEMTVNHYPPGDSDWSNYSMDVQAATKECHDRLLEELLGKPTEAIQLSSSLQGRQSTLDRPNWWHFPWGKVLSGHDSKGGDTFIMVEYGNRREEANRMFRSGSAGKG